MALILVEPLGVECVLDEMETNNPYAPVSSQDEDQSQTNRPRSWLLRFLIGFAIGASPPGLLGAYGMHQFSVYAASFPPGTPLCGNAALGPMMLILFVAPFLGLVGAIIAMAIPHSA
ncbi:MAG: hypothetical protein ABL921_20635 [Pirellula sp.]